MAKSAKSVLLIYQQTKCRVHRSPQSDTLHALCSCVGSPAVPASSQTELPWELLVLIVPSCTITSKKNTQHFLGRDKRWQATSLGSPLGEDLMLLSPRIISVSHISETKYRRGLVRKGWSTISFLQNECCNLQPAELFVCVFIEFLSSSSSASCSQLPKS